jgi:hypothetical protein
MDRLVAQMVRSRWMSVICLASLLAARLLPVLPEAPLCQFRRFTHLPCPGCGITRSFFHMAHLNLESALFFNPFGVMVFGAAVISAGLLVLPAGPRGRLAASAEKRPRMWNYLGGGLLVAFLLYGVGRVAWVAFSGRPSPW